MQSDRDLEAPWIGKDKDEPKNPSINFECDWCGEIVYEGESYYDIGGEKVCVECISDCKRSG